MEINSKAKTNYLIGLIILIIGLSLPIINLDRDIHFSCISMNEGNRIVLKGFVEPSEARFISRGSDVRLYSRADFLLQKSYKAKIYKVDEAISYYNGIAYRPIYGEVPPGTFRNENVILDGVLKIKKVSTFKLMLVTILNWLEPYSGEKIYF